MFGNSKDSKSNTKNHCFSKIFFIEVLVLNNFYHACGCFIRIFSFRNLSLKIKLGILGSPFHQQSMNLPFTSMAPLGFPKIILVYTSFHQKSVTRNTTQKCTQGRSQSKASSKSVTQKLIQKCDPKCYPTVYLKAWPIGKRDPRRRF